ncbi:MAG TPA: pyridoxal-phosphate dependent enzyme [Longilinea sp.]|nr:pyridoxal-phosphate dependent enzyme [Longilinea sp.]
MSPIRCTSCFKPYPDQGVPFRCPVCGGVYDFSDSPVFDPAKVESSLPGLWRYRHAFELPDTAPVVSLGEGLTPLLWDVIEGQRIGFKLEYLNPTGSYKDRGSAMLTSQLLSRGVSEAVEDSSGNAGASFAAYAARAGIKAKVYVPESASGPKRVQIERYGAELRPIPGPRSEAAQAVLAEAQRGVAYASHAYLPFGLAGIATIAFELWEATGEIGTVIAPVGHGGLLLGLRRGFAALKNQKLIKHLPYFVGVQAAACSPVVAAYKHGLQAMVSASEGTTIAEGVRVRHPVRAEALLREILPDQGIFLGVTEDRILPAANELARKGVYVEPTSALVWAAFRQLSGKIAEPIILILSGSGYKVQPSNS